jgi:hypothetical protein
VSNPLEHPITQLATYRELTPAERQSVQAHLAACDECHAQFEAFRKQDALLTALPDRLPRRQLQIEQGGSRFWNGLTRLGNLMAAGGLAALTLASGVIVWAAATSLAAQTVSAPSAPGAPLTLPPDLPARVNPWILAAPWLGSSMVVIGALLALGKRNRVFPKLGIALAVLWVFTYVPPVTALPNPAGLIWRASGGYSYDPNLPFRNLIVISGDPAAKLRPYMDRLIGQVGLDPLDPVQPLARYAFERVTQPSDKRVVLVTTRFTYANGVSRVYDVPLFDPIIDLYISNWQNDGLGRLRTEHLALPGQPFAAVSSPVRLGDATRLRLSPQADQLDAANPFHWAWISNRLQRLVWSPQGDAFLMVEQQPDHTEQLWLIPLSGSPPQRVNQGGSVIEYGWSPDGAFIVYTAPEKYRPLSGSYIEKMEIVVVRRDALAGGKGPVVQRAIASASQPDLTRQGIWYVQDGVLWLMDYQTGESARVVSLPDFGPPSLALVSFLPVAVSPDGSRLAYACGKTDLCLTDLDGRERHTIPATGIRAITWDRTGAHLAATSLDYNNFGPVQLLIVTREGEVQHQVAVAPYDATDPPQWTPDGQLVFLQTYPMNGRRILTVNADTGDVLDLSREHWDTYFALSPDGKNLLLNNGRGGFWLAPVIRQ